MSLSLGRHTLGADRPLPRTDQTARLRALGRLDANARLRRAFSPLAAFRPRPVPDRRFDVWRRAEMRRFPTALLLVQMAYAIIGATTGGPGALSSDRVLAVWLGGGFVAASAALLVVVRRARNIRAVETAGLVAGILSFGLCLLGQLLDKQTAQAVTLYEAAAIGVVAYAVPWRPASYAVWVGVGTVSAIGGLMAADVPEAERAATLGALAFVLVVSLLGKTLAWNRSVERHLQQAELRRVNARLRIAARTDASTGVGNRQALQEDLARICARRSGRVGLALIDVDHFKGVNDAQGHLAGDDVLRVIVRRVQDQIRGADRVFRYGGEEFLVVFDGADGDGLACAAERIRAGVESARLPNPASGYGIVTVSVGTVEITLPADHETLLGAIATADANLYLAKRAGRNCIQPPPCNPAPAPVVSDVSEPDARRRSDAGPALAGVGVAGASSRAGVKERRARRSTA